MIRVIPIPNKPEQEMKKGDQGRKEKDGDEKGDDHPHAGDHSHIKQGTGPGEEKAEEDD